LGKAYSERYPVVTCALAVLVLLVPGCVTVRTTDTPRTATEQLLVSTAVDRALEGLDLSSLKGRTVFVVSELPESPDRGYVTASVRSVLCASGAFIAPDKAKADTVLELRCGSLGTNYAEALLGMPESAVPIPLAQSFTIPEFALFKTANQSSVAKLGVLAYEKGSGKQLASAGPLVGKAYVKRRVALLFFKFEQTDIPEKKGNWAAHLKAKVKRDRAGPERPPK